MADDQQPSQLFAEHQPRRRRRRHEDPSAGSNAFVTLLGAPGASGGDRVRHIVEQCGGRGAAARLGRGKVTRSIRYARAHVGDTLTACARRGGWGSSVSIQFYSEWATHDVYKIHNATSVVDQRAWDEFSGALGAGRVTSHVPTSSRDPSAGGMGTPYVIVLPAVVNEIACAALQPDSSAMAAYTRARRLEVARVLASSALFLLCALVLVYAVMWALGFPAWVAVSTYIQSGRTTAHRLWMAVRVVMWGVRVLPV